MTGPAGRAALLRPLAHRQFRLLWTGQLLSALGSEMLPLALAVLLLRRGAGPTGLGVLLGLLAASTVLGTVAAAAVGDRWRRADVMIGSDAVRIVAVAVLAAAGTAGPGWLVALLVVLAGFGEGLFRPAFGAIVPRLLPESLLQQGNALTTFSLQVAAFASPAAAGVLVATTSPLVALWVDAASFLASIATLVLVRAAEEQPAVRPRLPGVRHAVREVGTDFVEGVRAVTGRPWVAASIAMATVIMTLSVAPAFVLLPLAAQDRLGGPTGYGLVLAGLGVGSLVGSVVGGRIRPRRPGVVATVGVLTITCSVSALAVLPLPGVVAAWAVAGVGVSIFQILWVTALQRDVPDEVLGRVLALDWLGTSGLMPLGYALAGPLALAVGAKPVLLAGALVVLLVAPLPLLVRGGTTFSSAPAVPAGAAAAGGPDAA
jgi:MFS family permease